MKNLYVIDDDDISRDWIAEAMEMRPDIRVVTFESGTAFLKAISKLDAGVVLMDLRMPGLSGIETLEQYNDELERYPTVLMSAVGDVECAVKAMRLGATDFLVKPFAQRNLLTRVGEVLVQLEQHVEALESQNSQAKRFAKLTDRETEVLRLLIDGHPNRHISEKLGLSVRTVETYRGKLMDKLGVGSLPEAIRLAYTVGFVELTN